MQQHRKIIFIFLIALLAVSCINTKHPEVQGYIEGRYTYLSSALSGRLEKLIVSRGDKIKAGDLIFMLDQQPETDQLKQAEKNLTKAQQVLIDLQKGQRQTVLDQIKAQRAQAVTIMQLDKKTLSRYQKLYAKHAIDKASVDAAESNYQRDVKRVSELDASLAEAKSGARENQIKAQQATVEAVMADLKRAKWALAQKTMYAPVSGFVFDTYYHVGEFISPNQPVVSLLAPENIKLIFFVPESMLSKISVGEEIQFICDSCKEKTAATISFISSQAEYTPPVIYSKETRDKLVYRIEAKIAPDVATHFHPGQPVDVYL
jgi:HlyD family secretion protein